MRKLLPNGIGILWLLFLSTLTSPLAAQYCTPTYGNACSSGDYIDGVIFNTISNLGTGCTGSLPGNLTDYTATFSTSVNPGASYVINVDVSDSWGQYVVAFIDFNGNLNYDDPGEFFDIGYASAGTNVTGTIDIPSSSIITGLTRMRVMCAFGTTPLTQADVCGSPTYGEVEEYEIDILPVPSENMALLSLSSPVSGCGLTASETISGLVVNNGTDTVVSVLACYTLNGGTPVCGTVTGPFPPGDTLTLIFPTPADLSVPMTHVIDANITAAADPFSANDSLFGYAVENSPIISTLPYIQDFESGSGGWTSGGANSSWEFGTPAGTYITGANSGVNAWATNLTGGYNNFEESFLLSPCMDFSGVVTDPLLRFAHIFQIEEGFDQAWVEISLDGGATWNVLGIPGSGTNWYNVADSTWDLNSGPAGTWRIAEQLLTGAAGNGDVRLRFRFSTDVSVTPEGMGVDDIQVFTSFSDATLVEMELPESDCNLSASEMVTLWVLNKGTDTLFNVPVCVSVDGGTAVCDTILTPLAPGDTLEYLFSGTLDLSAFGPHTVVGYTNISTDDNPGNDTLMEMVSNFMPISTFPFCEDFDAWIEDEFNPVPLPENWVNDPNDGPQDWFVLSGATTSTGTGPDQDHTTGSGNYLYIEDSGFDNDTINLVSPCIDPGGETLNMSFWYHSFNDGSAATENLVVLEVWDGITWTTLDSIGSDTLAWVYAEYDMSAYASSVIKIRWRGNNNNGDFVHDIAIDDFCLDLILSANASVASIDSLPDTTCGGGIIPICVTIENSGLDTISTPFPVTYIVGTDTVTELFVAVPLAEGETAAMCFTSPADISMLGSNSVIAYTNLPGDIGTGDDTASTTVTVIPEISTFPYVEDFEGGPAGWSEGGAASSWAFGTPAKDFIIGAASGANAWVTGGLGTGNYNTFEASYVLGPCFDFSTLTDPWVKMKIWWASETGYDGAILQSSVDGGLTWQVVGAFGDPDNWYNDPGVDAMDDIGFGLDGWAGDDYDGLDSKGWVVAKHGLTGLAGEPEVKIRIFFASDVSITDDGFAFDDFVITEGEPIAPLVDLGPDTALCDTFPIVLDAGNPGDMYLWSTGDTTQTITVSGADTIWVTVMDSLLCAHSDTVIIGVGGTISIDAINLDYTFCPLVGFSATLTGAPSTFDWDFGDTLGTSTDDMPTYDYSLAGNGTYTATLTVSSCGVSDTLSEVVNISCLVGTESPGLTDLDLNVYPNPNSGIFTVKFTGSSRETASLEVLNLQGKSVYKTEIPGSASATTHQVELDVPAGIYLLSVRAGGQQSYRKLILEK